MNNLNKIFEIQKNKLKDKPLFWHKENSEWISISWNEANKQIKLINCLSNKIGPKGMVGGQIIDLSSNPYILHIFVHFRL